MRNFKLITFIMLPCIIALALQFSCTPSSICGATDTETGNVVVGVILNKNGCTVENVVVTLIPDSYNPMEDKPLPDSFTTVTDAEGRYLFSNISSGTFNICSIHDSGCTGFLHTGIILDSAATVHDTGILAPTGCLVVKLPDTVDTDNGYIYFKGTQFFLKLNTAQTASLKHLNFIFNALPPSIMPQLYYSQLKSNKEVTLLASSVTINELDTVVLETSTNTVKPLWRFSILVGVKNTVSTYFGGLDNMIPRIDSQFAAVSEIYNSTNYFDGTFLIAADSIYEYSAAITEEGNLPLDNFDYRLLYDVIDQPVVLHEITRSKYFYLWGSPPDYLFKDICTDYFVAMFGDCRGAYNLSWSNVNASSNAVTHTSFTAVQSIFHNPETYSTWDDYSISVINHNGGNTGSERDILHTAFPDQMGIYVTTSEGAVVQGGEITVYGCQLNTQTVTTDTLLTGVTDDGGKFIFPKNPFLSEITNLMTYGNLLITISTGTDSTFVWFPVYEAGNANFNNGSAPYFKEVSF